MISLLTIILLLCALGFPTFIICCVYPFSKKAALFWSNYITGHTSRIFFAILKTFRGFTFEGDYESKKGLPEQFVLVSNHQSLIDIVVYLHFFRPQEVRFVAKDSLAKAPMVGKMLKSQQHCMIPRSGNPAVAMNALEKFGKRARERKQLPLIFPEGTRSKDGNLGKFYAAGFRRLEETVQLPVVVCALDGGWRLNNLNCIAKNLKKGSYKVKVLKVFDAPKTKEEEKSILEEAPVLIQAQLNEWRS